MKLLLNGGGSTEQLKSTMNKLNQFYIFHLLWMKKIIHMTIVINGF